LIIDARIKPHHAPPVEVDSKVEASIEKHFKKGGALYQIEK
jgi:4-hydroxy-3-polyprenylbenzoate decarboxylase